MSIERYMNPKISKQIDMLLETILISVKEKQEAHKHGDDGFTLMFNFHAHVMQVCSILLASAIKGTAEAILQEENKDDKK